jgi:hypothetical protein
MSLRIRLTTLAKRTARPVSFGRLTRLNARGLQTAHKYSAGGISDGDAAPLCFVPLIYFSDLSADPLGGQASRKYCVTDPPLRDVRDDHLVPGWC